VAEPAVIRRVAARLVGGLGVIAAVATVCFFLLRAAPGGPFDSEAHMSPEIQRNLEERYHLRDPLWRQYATYMAGLVRGDLGPSITRPQTVNELIAAHFPVSAVIGLGGLAVAIGLGIPIGVAAARRHKRWPDRALMTLAAIGVSVPAFVVGPLLVGLVAIRLGWLPPVRIDGPSGYRFIFPNAPKPFEPAQLVQFGRVLSYPLFRQFGQELHCFTDMFAQSSMGQRDVIFDGEPEPVSAEMVSGNYYSVLGVSAFAGRTFDPEIDRNPIPVAVISHAYWERRFVLDPAVIGRSFRWKGRVFTIIGVTPPDFHGVVAGTLPEITLPLSLAGEILDDPARLTSDSMNWLSVMGRLRTGYTIERAQAAAQGIMAGINAAKAVRREMPRT